MQKEPPYLTSDDAQRRLIDSLGRGLSWERTPNFVASTHDEAESVVRMHLPKRIALVTSRFHTRRACAAFERVGFEVTCVSAGWGEWWKFPYFAAYEGAGLIEYRLRGWI